MSISKAKRESLLIIFYKNPELGKVKTRLASSIGDAKAFSIYLLLAEYTRRITEHLAVHKVVFYSDYIDVDDSWPHDVYQKRLQMGADLGERMENAFKSGFNEGYKSICIIGTDCLELTRNIIEEAFRRLLTHDIVIGPANDGGYYLLGMNYFYNKLFQNKRWSSNTVLADTLADTRMLGLTSWQLETLTDVDEEKDLPQHFIV
jgi:rSAM/selenodomain-associated transferase 1